MRAASRAAIATGESAGTGRGPMEKELRLAQPPSPAARRAAAETVRRMDGRERMRLS